MICRSIAYNITCNNDIYVCLSNAGEELYPLTGTMGQYEEETVLYGRWIGYVSSLRYSDQELQTYIILTDVFIIKKNFNIPKEKFELEQKMQIGNFMCFCRYVILNYLTPKLEKILSQFAQEFT